MPKKRKRRYQPRRKRADTHFRGVYYRPTANPARPYVAWIYHDGKAYQLGYFAEDREAAIVADLARYLLRGPYSKAWISGKRRRPANPPNFPPITKLWFNPQEISRKLHEFGLLSQDRLNSNLKAYAQIAAWLEGKTA